LISDVKLWLEGMSSVSLCMLISIVEKPYYKCPVKDKMDEEKFEKLGFPDPGELKPQHFYLEGRFGPVIYKGLDDELDDEEVGDEEPDDEEPDNEEVDDEEVDDEEVDNEEVGDEEPDDDEVDDKVDDKVGDKESSDEELDIGELKWVGSISTAFLERWRRNARTGEAQKYGKRIDLLTARSIKFKRSDFMDTTRKNDRTISIDCEAFRDFLAIKMKVLAAERCREMLLDRIRRGRDLRDKGYTPS